MKIPEFTAEVSLYRTGELNKFSATGVANATGQQVVPQWDWDHVTFNPKCIYGPCIPIFYCVDPIGCKVVGHKRQRCCYLGSFSLGCNWVACAPV